MLEINLSGLKLKSPIILASGILGVSYSSMKRVIDAGAGAVTSKSIGPIPRKGYKNPSIIEVYPGTFMNAVGLGNPGIDGFIPEIKEIKDKLAEYGLSLGMKDILEEKLGRKEVETEV